MLREFTEKDKNMLGKTFGILTVIELLPNRSDKFKGSKLCLCKCECDSQIIRPISSIRAGDIKSCGCLHRQKYLTKDITLRFWNKLFESYKKRFVNTNRTLEFNITPEYLQEIWDIQNGKCCFTGINLHISKSQKDYENGTTTASVDRINNSLGYIKGNIRLVNKTVNICKTTLSDERFIELCRKVSDHAKL